MISFNFRGSWMLRVQAETGIRPIYTLANAGLMCTISQLSLQMIVSCEMLLFTAVSLSCFAAFVQLKATRPDLPRAFVMPGGVPGAVALAAVPSIIMLVQLFLAIIEAM